MSLWILLLCLYKYEFEFVFDFFPHFKNIYSGGGIVGLATARELAVRGKSVILLEKEASIISGVSSGNSGIGCTGDYTADGTST